MSEVNLDGIEENVETTDSVETSKGTTLEEIGAKTIGDLLKKTLEAAGITHAVGFEVVLNNGGTHTILSDSNPVMQRPASEVSSVKIKQSAEAGLSLI